ncbi:MAG TPA: TRAP transporter large permease [Deinococcales bacterium]|nr:TRAP transporter large permease [Deinococcales bacterium]
MSPAFIVIVLATLFMVLVRIPVGLAFMAGGMWYLLLSGRDMGLAAEQIMNGSYSNFVILAVPMFIFMSRVASAGTFMQRLVDFSLALVGSWRGGLAHVNVLASVILSGMSGSAIADAAGSGRLQIEMMTIRKHYSEAYAAAITASSAVIGPIIPPSIPMILYALVSGTSLGALFLGGLIPGLFMSGMLMLAVWYTANVKKLPVDAKLSLREIGRTTVKSILPILMPVILLGGIYSGIFTPTEAAGVAAVYVLILTGLIYRELNWAGVYGTFASALRDSTVTMTVVAGSLLLNYVLTVERIPNLVLDSLGSLELGRVGLLLLINLLFLLLGMFLDSSVLLLVAVPLVFPVVAAAGIDPVHFGVVIVLNIMIGLITPPFGVLLFIVKGFVKAPIGEIIREDWPFLIVLLASLLLLVLVPDIVTWLPRIAMGR